MIGRIIPCIPPTLDGWAYIEPIHGPLNGPLYTWAQYTPTLSTPYQCGLQGKTLTHNFYGSSFTIIVKYQWVLSGTFILIFFLAVDQWKVFTKIELN